MIEKIVITKENLDMCADEIINALENARLKVISYCHSDDDYTANYYKGRFSEVLEPVDPNDNSLDICIIATHTYFITLTIGDIIIIKDNQVVFSKAPTVIGNEEVTIINVSKKGESK